MKTICLSAVLLFAFGIATAQSIFSNPITGTNPNTDNPYTIGQLVNPAITVSGIGRGTGITGAAANNRYNASSWNTAALDADAYFEFTITPNGGSTINFTSFEYTGQVSNATISNYAFRSSIDGFTADIGVPVATGATIALSAAAYQGIMSAITFRLYAWGADQASRTFSINDFTFNGVTNVLPITLEYFEGIKQNSVNMLSWKMNCSGSDHNAVTIERSADGSHFIPLQNIVASAFSCLQPFSYADNAPLTGYNYYRLKIIDENGHATQSSSILVLNKVSGFDIVSLVPLIPDNSILLNISAVKKMQLTLAVTDIAGRLLQKNIHYVFAGSNQLKIDLFHLPSGFYLATVYTSDGTIKTLRFVK